ncbi:MAG: NYN domain-containing protein [Ignavibacteria bacterium]
MKIILIDGNNVIHKSALLKKIFMNDKIAARQSFVEKVKTHLGRGCKIEFYFDGHSEQSFSGIYFSGNKTADELIRKRIENSNDHRNMTVVSSDHGITGLAKICGCTIMKSEEFLIDLEGKENIFKGKNINHVIEKDNEKPNSVSRKELDFFRDKFC